MKLQDWQKREIEPTVHAMLNGQHNDLGVIYAAIERVCSGQAPDTGVDHIAEAIRGELGFRSKQFGGNLPAEQIDMLTAELRRMFVDLAAVPTFNGIAIEELMRRAVKGAVDERAPDGQAHPRWVGVQRRFGLGSTFSIDLCRRFGVDPHEVVIRTTEHEG